MNEALIERWNGCVKPGDTIYHLGDFGFCSSSKMESILSRLNGNIHVILGNHDHQLKNARFDPYFESLTQYKEIVVDNTRIVLFHYPIKEWNRAHHGALHLHGHLHSDRVYGRSMDIGADSNDCTPHNIRDIIKKLNSTEIVSEYHEVRDTEK